MKSWSPCVTFGLWILKGILIGDQRITSKNWIFRIIEIRIIGSFIAIDNREKSRDCPSSSNNPVVSDNRRSDNRDLTVFVYSQPEHVLWMFQKTSRWDHKTFVLVVFFQFEKFIFYENCYFAATPIIKPTRRPLQTHSTKNIAYSINDL